MHIAVSERGHLDAYGADRYRYDGRWFSGKGTSGHQPTSAVTATPSRFPPSSMATLIAHVTFDFLDALPSDRRLRILSFLTGSGLTATFELLQPEHMHVEILLNKTPKFAFLGWTMPDPAGAR